MRTGNSVSSICQRVAVTIRPNENLTAAAQLMRDKHIGCLVVTDFDSGHQKERPVGVITDRDIVVTVVARDADPKSLRVEDVMTRQPTLVPEGASIATALQQMRRIGVRRLPVVDYRGHLVGILSLDDVIGALAGELQDVAASIETERRIEGALRP
jgi:CBS domain-containing protein